MLHLAEHPTICDFPYLGTGGIIWDVEGRGSGSKG